MGSDESGQEHLLNCLARHVIANCNRDGERIREWLERWKALHGDESYRDLRERCAKEYRHEKKD